MGWDIMALTFGGGLLYIGGDWLVDGVSSLAKRFRVPPVLVAFILLGFGTSAPELFVATNAALTNKPDIAVGNIVGSNIANLLLVLAMSAVMAPLTIDRITLRIDGSVMLGAAATLWLLALDGVVSRFDAAILITGLGVYLLMRWRSLFDVDDTEEKPPVRKAVMLSVAALLALPIGADLFVEAAGNIARELGVSEAIIGVTLVAIGTSLPEIAVSLTAALQRQTDMILGGILGSNVFNGTLVLGSAALLRPMAVGDVFLQFWIPAMFAATVLALIFLRTGHRLSRAEGGTMLAAYVLILIA